MASLWTYAVFRHPWGGVFLPDVALSKWRHNADSSNNASFPDTVSFKSHNNLPGWFDYSHEAGPVGVPSLTPGSYLSAGGWILNRLHQHF